MRWRNVLIVVGLAAGACSSGGGGSEPAETGTPTVERGTQTVETGTQGVESTGPPGGGTVGSDPIMSVVTAHDVDEVGVPLEPALEFAPEVPQISVLVRVGEVETDASLEVAWIWLDGPDGEQPLFEHQIDVGAGDVAYSHGVAGGPLAAGRYRANVTLGASSAEALFAVRYTPIVLPEGVSGFARQESTEEPDPPARGLSGRIPTQHDYGSVAVCTPWVSFSSLLAMTGASGCGDAVGDDHNLLEVTAWVGGNSPFGLGQARGDFIKPVQADPCDLGGSDLETEPVSYAVTVISGPDEGQRYTEQGPPPEPDTHTPMAFLASQPLPGAQVNAGDTIVVEITADDKSSVDSVISGIASVTLTADGHEVDGLEFTGPEACDKSRLRRVVQLEYVVPENPPELVTLVATVRDYEGHETTVESSYPTVGLWTGYMDVVGSSVTEVTIQAGPVRCTSGWEFRVVFFARSSGELYGYADGIATAPHECDAPFAPIDLPATRLGISGTMTPDAVTLRFEHQSGGWAGIAVLYTPPAPDVVVPRSGTQAFGEIDLTLVTEVPNNTFTENVTGRIDLGCEEC
jgi:hypothetical protein